VTHRTNWDDDLGGSPELTGQDPVLQKISAQVREQYEQTYMFHLPRICEHCINPSCAASCPSGAIYKRTEDGIVLVDQDRCRGWRMCVTGCPYKKVYFNHRTGKAEKCTFCFPSDRTRVGGGRFQALNHPEAEDPTMTGEPGSDTCRRPVSRR
jgi:nitrate reductase / nitrite oxidoreductase, beta subunit